MCILTTFLNKKHHGDSLNSKSLCLECFQGFKIMNVTLRQHGARNHGVNFETSKSRYKVET